ELRGDAMRELRSDIAQRTPALISNAPRWQSVGPNAMTMLSWGMGLVAGRVTALGVRPGNENVLYLGTAAGGFWKSTNGGTSWTRLSDALDSPSIGAVLVNAGAGSAPDDVWVGTGEAFGGGCNGYFGQGLFHSTDGGATFAARNGSVAAPLNLSFINAIARHPTNPQILLAGGTGKCSPSGSVAGTGIYRSTDAGTNWTRVSSVGSAMDLLFDPVDGNIAYASINGFGVYKSIDGGVTWSQVQASTAGLQRIAMAPSNHSLLYSLTSGSVLARSIDAGATWTTMNSTACEGQCTYNLTIDVHPTDPARVLIGTIRPALSTDSGTTLTIITTSWGSAQKVHQDTHVVRYSRTDGARFWVGSDGGLWRTDDTGTSYANLNTGLNITQFYDVALDVRDPARIYGGAQDNSSSLRNANNVWNVTFVSGDGFMNASEPAAGANNGKNVYQTSYPSGTPSTPSIYRSASFGAPNTFSKLTTTGAGDGSAYQWVTPLVVTQGQVFTASSLVYRGATSQTTGSFVWTPISPTLGAATVVLSDPDPAGVAPLRLYAGTTGGGVWTTADALAASPVWTDVSSGAGSGRVSDIATQPGNSAIVYAIHSTFGTAKLYKSLNSGSSWSAVGAGLPVVPANSVLVDTLEPQRVFVGTDIGVYESINGGVNFSPMMLDLPPGTVVSDLEIYANPHVLVAGTYGSGAWKFNLLATGDRIFENGFDR
ncbi:MAG: hypothetical protein ABI411_18725, partial [Tahibacter sp.]